MKFLLLFFVFTTATMASEKTLKVDDVLNSAKSNYPIILKGFKDLEASKAQFRSSRGQFDAQLSAKQDRRTEGYYDGEALEVMIEKPLQFLNSKVYAGFRESEGNFPVYEGKYNTLDGGEYKVGLEFSLLQNRGIDEKRLKLWNDEIEIKSKEQELTKTKLKVQKDAFKAYWAWVLKAKVMKVYENLLDIAEKRGVALKKKVKRGDVAQIYVVENNQYIARRKASLIQAKRDLNEAALNLSLYYRNQEGVPIMPKIQWIPEEIFNLKRFSAMKLNEDVEKALKLNPNLQKINNKILQLRNEKEFGENKLLPKLDFNVEVSEDQGDGSKTLQGRETRGMVKLVIPIERNLGKGKIAKASAKERGLLYFKQILSEQVRNIVRDIYFTYNSMVEKIENVQQEVENARVLEKAEMKKFDSGDSDFFVINLREQNTAYARIKRYKAFYQLKESLAEYKQFTFGFDLN